MAPAILTVLSTVFLLLPFNIHAADFVDPVTSMEFVSIKGGQYNRGDETGMGRENERPAHRVKVTDFFMGKYEVTVSQFSKFVEDTGHQTAPEKRGWVYDIDAAMGTYTRKDGISWKNPGFKQKENHPVVWVDWNDAVAYAAWLSGRSGQTYDLPTEAQWEYAAKAAGSSRWAGTSDKAELPAFAWYAKNSGLVTHEVGTLDPNALGIHDLSGNVWEWCFDGYGGYRYAADTREDPIVRTGTTRTIRGGSWRVGDLLVTTTYRNGYKPDYSHSSMGFRLVRKIE